MNVTEVIGSIAFGWRVPSGSRLSQATFAAIFEQGWIVDARAGGLVVGRSHAQGNIYMIIPDGEYYVFEGNLQRGEYVLTHQAAFKFGDRLREINSEAAPEPETIPIKARRVLNTSARPFDKLLLFDPRRQFIVNHRSTALHLDELEDMNEAENDFLCCDLNCIIRKPEEPEAAAAS